MNLEETGGLKKNQQEPHLGRLLLEFLLALAFLVTLLLSPLIIAEIVSWIRL